jgi:hypothetical protein
MGELLERVKLSNLVNGNGIADNYKNNSLYFYQKYRKSDKEVTAIPLSKIQAGRFYFFHYMDDSNWMKWSPVYVISLKQFESLKIIFAVNFNFVPFEVRTTVFDEAMIEKNFEKDLPLKMKFDDVYKLLRRYSFEYSIREYNMEQIKLCHKIEMDSVPRFLYSGHPKNKYDARKLYSIWKAKILDKNKRDAEMSQLIMKDFIDMSEEVTNKYDVLKKHIESVQRSIQKYGRQS